MAEVPRFVLDASVGAKWHLLDEPLGTYALSVRQDFVDGRIRLIAPDLVTHEVSSSILKATRNPKRNIPLRYEVGQREVEAWLSWGVELLPANLLAPVAYRIAGRYGCSYYDAVYLALADQTRTPFLYADKKLRTALRDRFPFALWIEDYRHDIGG